MPTTGSYGTGVPSDRHARVVQNDVLTQLKQDSTERDRTGANPAGDPCDGRHRVSRRCEQQTFDDGNPRPVKRQFIPFSAKSQQVPRRVVPAESRRGLARATISERCNVTAPRRVSSLEGADPQAPWLCRHGQRELPPGAAPPPPSPPGWDRQPPRARPTFVGRRAT